MKRSTQSTHSDLSRRDALKLCLAPVGIAAAGWASGCASGRDDISENPREDAEQYQLDSDAGVTSWATGGTKAMSGNYPDPFATSPSLAAAACPLYPAMMVGPCYSGSPAEREDISDGLTGVPLRLSFLVVQGAACSPVPNAVVDIWHPGVNGVYSAYASGICNPERLPVVDQRYCRGTQTTDANGRANFSTIFPGWYALRSIHIHFTVRAGAKSFTSQLFFEDLLSDEILATTEYASRGKRSTKNGNDILLLGMSLPSVLMSTAKRSDGALHAWKVLSLRA